MTAVVCPVCRGQLGERSPDGTVLVRRGGHVVAINPQVIPCCRRHCSGFVELDRRVTATVSGSANGR